MFSDIQFYFNKCLNTLEADGGSEENQKRRDTCGSLVKPYPPKSNEQSGEQPSTAAALLTTLNPITDQKTDTYGTTVDGCVCVCDQSTVSGITLDYTNSEENDDFTNDSDETTSGGPVTTSKPWSVPSCDFTKYMWNISLSLSYEYQIILQEWIYEIEYKYISQYELYSEDELVVLIGYSLKHFSLNYTEIWKEISFEKIGSWGYCAEFISVRKNTCSTFLNLIRNVVIVGNLKNTVFFLRTAQFLLEVPSL